MKPVTRIARHGDVLIKTHEGFAIPKDVVLSPAKLIERGSSAEHFIKSGEALQGTDKDGVRYLRVVKDAVIAHSKPDGHGDGDIPAGDYFLEIKSEYDHLTEEARQVVD